MKTIDDYDIVVRHRDGKFFLFIPDLYLAATAEKITDAQEELAARFNEVAALSHEAGVELTTPSNRVSSDATRLPGSPGHGITLNRSYSLYLITAAGAILALVAFIVFASLVKDFTNAKFQQLGVQLAQISRANQVSGERIAQALEKTEINAALPKITEWSSVTAKDVFDNAAGYWNFGGLEAARGRPNRWLFGPYAAIHVRMDTDQPVLSLEFDNPFPDQRLSIAQNGRVIFAIEPHLGPNSVKIPLRDVEVGDELAVMCNIFNAPNDEYFPQDPRPLCIFVRSISITRDKGQPR